MSKARLAATLTWMYAAGFGLSTIPVAWYLLRRGRLPTFLGLFQMYGGPWSAQPDIRVMVLRLMAFLVVTTAAAWTGWLVRNGSRRGAMFNVALLPVEAVFWIGFALPIPWAIGLARAVLIGAAWNSFH